MFKEIDILDSLGMYKEADALLKIILSNNFMLTKKKKNPQEKTNRRLDLIDSQLFGINQALENPGENKDSNETIVVEPYKENDVEKVKLNLN